MNEHATVKFGADTTAFQRKIQQMTGLTQKQVNLMMSALAGLSMRRLYSEITQVIDALDDMAKMARVMGQTFRERAELDYIAKIVGADINAIDKALIRLGEGMSKGGDDAKRLQRALAGIGESFESIKDKSAVDQLVALARAIDGIENEVERLDAANSAFGARGAAVAFKLATDYEKLQAQAASVVGVTEDAARAAEQYNDALVDLGQAWRAALSESGAIEALAAIVKGMASWLDSTRLLMLAIPALALTVAAASKTMLASLAAVAPTLLAIAAAAAAAEAIASAAGEMVGGGDSGGQDTTKLIRSLQRGQAEAAKMRREMEGMSADELDAAANRLERYKTMLASLTPLQRELAKGAGGTIQSEDIDNLAKYMRLQAFAKRETAAAAAAASETARELEAAAWSELAAQRERLTLTQQEAALKAIIEKSGVDETGAEKMREYMRETQALMQNLKFNEMLAAMREQNDMQDMIIAGREREVELLRLQKELGRELTAEERRLLDIELERAKIDPEASADSAFGQAQQSITKLGTDLLRLGGVISGSGVGQMAQRESLSLDKRRNSTLEQINSNIQKLNVEWGLQ